MEIPANLHSVKYKQHIGALAAIGVKALLAVALAGCSRQIFDPARATRPYPSHLHQAISVDIQVFRDDEQIELINATPHSYRDFDLWINQRYVLHVDELPSGGSISLSLWDFYDERGERVNAGGFWRTEKPTPVRLVEIQLAEDEPMIGLITIRAEDPEPNPRRMRR